ncbi:hypothetical protein lerEdw1_009828 [Lerista edwardsae]|nr:hypothetical protein lerEdw1_009828 [Lerista edwardsae]
MKGALVLCVISALLPGLHGLKCAQCLIGNSTCTTCDNADQICIAIQAVSPTAQPNGMYKGCIASAQCKPLSVSLSTFSDRHFQSTTACCNSNECNTNLTINGGY